MRITCLKGVNLIQDYPKLMKCSTRKRKILMMNQNHQRDRRLQLAPHRIKETVEMMKKSTIGNKSMKISKMNFITKMTICFQSIVLTLQ